MLLVILISTLFSFGGGVDGHQVDGLTSCRRSPGMYSRYQARPAEVSYLGFVGGQKSAMAWEGNCKNKPPTIHFVAGTRT